MKNIARKSNIPPCETCTTKDSAHSIFCTLKTEEQELLSQHKAHFHFKRGHTIFHENSQVQGIYCIFSGKVLIHKHVDAREQVVRMARPGDWIGYRALISEEPFTASATALEEVQACFIPRHVFMGLLKENNGLAIETLKLLARNLKTAEIHWASMVHKHADGRMAEALLALGEFYGYEEDKMTIKVHLSRENLAGIAGITTETAIRLLSAFNKDKLIKLIGKRIKLLDIQKLNILSNK
ncbi:MAG: Crp/Fnr family transcriptional regulator [Bacteroidia bacterium]